MTVPAWSRGGGGTEDAELLFDVPDGMFDTLDDYGEGVTPI